MLHNDRILYLLVAKELEAVDLAVPDDSGTLDNSLIEPLIVSHRQNALVFDVIINTSTRSAAAALEPSGVTGLKHYANGRFSFTIRCL